MSNNNNKRKQQNNKSNNNESHQNSKKNGQCKRWSKLSTHARDGWMFSHSLQVIDLTPQSRISLTHASETRVDTLPIKLWQKLPSI